MHVVVALSAIGTLLTDIELEALATWTLLTMSDLASRASSCYKSGSR
jgi:hypothetical protein